MNNNINIEEEVFCLNFELSTLSKLILKTEAERWVFNFMNSYIEEEHLMRYKHVINKIENKIVLDIACGSGYGSYYLAVEGNPQNIIGVDLDQKAIRYGNYRYNHNKINRIIADATQFKYENKFEIIVCFETIEHIENYKSLLNNLNLLLSENGTLYISTPIVAKTTNNCFNPHHIIEWNMKDFNSLITEYFKVENIYIQNVRYYKKPESLIKRLINKLKRIIQNKDIYIKEEPNNANLILYSTIDSNSKIISGYQILECSKINII